MCTLRRQPCSCHPPSRRWVRALALQEIPSSLLSEPCPAVLGLRVDGLAQVPPVCRRRSLGLCSFSFLGEEDGCGLRNLKSSKKSKAGEFGSGLPTSAPSPPPTQNSALMEISFLLDSAGRGLCLLCLPCCFSMCPIDSEAG